MIRRLSALLATAGALLVAPAVAHASVSPGSIVFGDTTQNQTAWVTVTNDTGNTWYVDEDYFYDGEAYSTLSDSCEWTRLDAYTSCSIEIQFDAGDTNLPAGWYYDTLAFEHYDTGKGYYTYDEVSLNGAKDPAGTVSVSPGSIDFGTHTDATIQTVTVTNSENQPVYVTHGTVSGGAPYSITADACGTQLQSGDSCNIDVRFDGSASPGTYHDSMTLTYTDQADIPVRIDLAGTVPPPPVGSGDLSLSPSPLRFGKVRRAATESVVVTETVPNASAQVQGLAAGTSTGAFSIVDDHCTGRTLGTNDQCSFAVHFAAANPGRHRGTVTVFATAAQHPTYKLTLGGSYVGLPKPIPYASRGGASLRTFYPFRRDGYRDSIRYTVRTGLRHARAGGVVVSIEVWNGAYTRVVKRWTFHQRRARITRHTVRWSGRNLLGGYVRPGRYHIHTLVRSVRTETEGTAQSRWATVRARRGR